MSIAPHAVVIVHMTAALCAMGLGAVQLARVKGTPGHRVLGWTWVVLMLTVAVTSLWIPAFLHFTWIHLFTLLVLVSLPLALLKIRRGDVVGHARAMRSLYVGGLVIAGVFTLMPGRLLGNLLWSHVWGYLPRA
jgi:uncharacterized membrane protein